MTKKDLIEFLKNYPDDIEIKVYNDGYIDNAYGITEVVDFGRKAVVINGDYGDD